MSKVLPENLIDSHQRAKQKWKLLSNTFKAISLLKTYETHAISDVDDLIEEIKSSPSKQNYSRQKSLISEVIDEHKLREKLFSYIETSNPEDLEKIQELIENNPKRYATSPNSPESLLNKPLNNNRPVYEAAKLGYSETVSLLLEYGANPHLKCGGKMKETSLDVACRWRHFNVVTVLLEKSKWTKDELKHAMKNTSATILVLLRERLEDFPKAGCSCLVY